MAGPTALKVDIAAKDMPFACPLWFCGCHLQLSKLALQIRVMRKN